MIKSLFRYIIYAGYLSSTQAVMPTMDVYQEAQDVQTMGVYTAQISNGLLKLGNVVDIAAQLRELKSLQDVEKVGGAICKLCSSTQQQELQLYINQVNDDLCLQFSRALNSTIGAQQNIKSLQDIVKNFSANPKEAGLALQSASIQTQSMLQGTLAQIQILLAQGAQKQLAEEKLAKQNNTALYTGLKQNGL